ncbi:hypothetical protein EPN90_00165 [Patescibacteria group bacterium]|nr:MAG: hypothetical protein EPN90_00165 [Patescibacteria group bacterium]
MRLKTFVLSFAILPLIGAGCISVSSTAKTAAGGGVYKSADKAASWAQKSALPTSKGVQSIAGANIATFAFDPSDPKAIYAGTTNAGLLYSYDAAESWSRATGLLQGKVAAVAVAPKDKCTIFAAVGNRVLRSTDCNRTFETVYTDPRPEATITALVIDWFKPEQVYLGTAAGDLSRSTDGGATWSVVRRWDDGVSALVVGAGDSRKLWVATRSQGISFSSDAGATWTDLRKTMDEFEGARAFVALVEVRSAPGALIHASRFGLLKSTDGGATWQKLNILTPPQSVTITALAVNPKDAREIYYTTASKFYKTKDGGGSWTTADLPTSRAATALAVDPVNDAVLYLGVTEVKK